MRHKLFIGSSVEGLPVAYAVQSNLEHGFEATVWTQGVFELSKVTLESLIEALDTFHFAVFVFTADDILILRGDEHSAARDNVIFELGLFLGRLGRGKTYFIAPRSSSGLHLPSDLAGVTYAPYDAEREDKNLRAALGPACHAISNAAAQALKVTAPPTPAAAPITLPSSNLDDNDYVSILESWLGSRPSHDNTRAIRFDETDQALKLPPGTTKKCIEKAARAWHLSVKRVGAQTVLFSR